MIDDVLMAHIRIASWCPGFGCPSVAGIGCPSRGAGDNASLWNTAEAAERRRNSVVAREVQVAIPRELSPDTQIAAAFARFLRETHGVAVDVAVHNPRARDGESQPHAHLLMTTRRFSDDGRFGEKSRELEALKPQWTPHVNAD